MGKMERIGASLSLFFFVLILPILFNSCQTEVKDKDIKTKPVATKPPLKVPDFNADSAYVYIQAQVNFGSRVLGSEGHDKCAEYLIAKLKQFTDSVIVQKASVKVYNGNIFPIQNIIGSIRPELNNRILIAAHWDTRHVADQDIENRDKPILGANDGASGVGVALELARLLNSIDVKLGVDIILFDAEDYGQPDDVRPYVPDSYCLGSQYWAKNKHKPNYYARYGILLDMVGAKDAKFTMEGTSMRFAPDVTRGVWNTAASLGYSNVFISKKTKPITDDHYYINTIAGIPTIDIIEYSEDTPSNFGHYWHTHKDNMDIIDKTTLKAVGQTVLTYVINSMN